jgi:DNA-binding CsgD family transcriptional regulator
MFLAWHACAMSPLGSTLVGRRIESNRLSQLLTGGTERAAIVAGEPGVGKTALIEQVCVRAATEGWLVVRVIGVAAEEPLELGGLHQLMLRLEQFIPGVDERARAVLAPVLEGDPESAVSGLPMVTAVLNLLAVAAKAQPVLLVVDDAHLLDSISAEVLGAVGRRLTDPRVTILAGQRVPHPSAFSSAGWSQVPLAPLDADDAEQLLACAGVSMTVQTRAAILTAAAGNPLALTELPRVADRIEVVTSQIPLTERLVAVFGERLEHLDSDVRAELLRAALDGIVGGTQTANQARYLIDDVAPAIEARLLTVDPLGQIIFRHPLVAAAVVHQASPQERRDAHSYLAEIHRDVLLRRAAHLAAAVTEPDQDVAEILVRAARLSIRRGGLAAGVEWLRRATELSSDPQRRTALLADAVFAAARAGRIAEAQELLDATGLGEGQSALKVLADAYWALYDNGEVISTHRLLLDAVTNADALDDDALNRLANLLLSVTNFAGDAERRERTNAALLPLQNRLHPVILMYRTGVDDIADTAGAIRSALSENVPFLPQLSPRYVLLMAYPAYCIDAMAEFRAPLQQVFTQLSRHGASIDAVEGGRVVLLDLIATGNWEQAQEVGAECLEMSAQVQGSELLRHQFLADLGLLAASRGDLATARRYAAEVAAWSTPRGLHYLLGLADRIAVRVALAESDFEAAYQAATVIGQPGQFPRHRIQVGDDMLDVVEAAVLTGRLAEARAHAAEAVHLKLAEVSPRVAALTLAITAMTAPDSDAEELYQSALTHPGIAEFPFEHARILLAQGMWRRRKLRHTQARDALEQAADGFDRLGARPWADRARAEFRAARVQTGRSVGEPVTLSTQERRVAELAATGLTTKEIAIRLSLSPRTIDNHLHRAFRRLGVSRRDALSEALKKQDNSTSTDTT